MRNFVNETSFFEWNPELHKNYFSLAKDRIEVTIPKLNEMAFEQAELAGVPFSAFIANKTADDQTASNSLVLRGYVRTWMSQITSEYDRISLIDRLAGVRRPEQSDPAAMADSTKKRNTRIAPLRSTSTSATAPT